MQSPTICDNPSISSISTPYQHSKISIECANGLKWCTTDTPSPTINSLNNSIKPSTNINTPTNGDDGVCLQIMQMYILYRTYPGTQNLATLPSENTK